MDFLIDILPTTLGQGLGYLLAAATTIASGAMMGYFKGILARLFRNEVENISEKVSMSNLGLDEVVEMIKPRSNPYRRLAKKVSKWME
jgi:hypothetical protein